MFTDLPKRNAVAAMQVPSDDATCRLAREGRSIHAYNEEAFHYFLGAERERSRRSQRSLVLLLVKVVGMSPGPPKPLDEATAQKVLTGLWLSTRETDVIGWYREGRVAGAVLTPVPEGGTNVSTQIRARVSEALHKALPSSVRQRLRVRVYQLTARREGVPSKGVRQYQQAMTVGI